MKILPIGSVTVFVNVNTQQNLLLSDSILSAIKKSFEYEIRDRIKRSNFDHEFHLSFDQKRGCILETVTIGIVLVGTYKFIVDYDKIRNNLSLMFNDLKGLFLKITGKKTKDMSIDGTSIEEIKIIKELPENMKKLYETGKGVYYSEKTVTMTHKTSLMRNDLKTILTKKEFESLIKEIDEKK